MHLLYFSRDYTTHDHRFLSALAKSEHQVSYLRLERNSYAYEERVLPPQIEIIPWKGGKAPARLSHGPSLLFDLKRVIRDTTPDLILAGPIQSCAFLTALARFKPLVSMSWGYDLLQDAHRSASWEWATRFTLKQSAAMVGDCNTIRQLAISYGMRDKRIVTFPWGIDLEHFTPAEQPAKPTGLEKSFRLLSTRGWETIYGVDLIACAFAMVADQHPELQLIMLGNGSQASSLRRTLTPFGLDMAEQETGRSDILQRVLLPGQVGYADLPRWYRGANLYISASHSDGTSISLLEAMACGLPVLVSDIPGNREWVTPGQNGWLFRDGDVQALSQAILHALDNRARLPEMGHNARKIAEQQADWSKNFPHLFRAFEIARN
jgi:glycosyltransferase involved in cell wall biosynthesis